jgi:predicted flap endonuclease-1-like 5' DNA nuclease
MGADELDEPVAGDAAERGESRKRFWERLRAAPRPSWPQWLRLPWRGNDGAKPVPQEQQISEQPPDQAHEEQDEPSREIATVDLAERGTPTDSSRGKNSARPTRFFLDLDSPVVDAPSIGPRMARRLAAIGVETVADFLELSPEQAASRLGIKSFDPATLRGWQTQAQLVCRIPELRGHDAQLLVEAGVSRPEEIAGMNPLELWEQLAPVLETPAAARILRGAAQPDLDEIERWIACSRQARGLRAA